MAERSTIKKEYSLRANSATRKDTVVVWIKEVWNSEDEEGIKAKKIGRSNIQDLETS